MDNQIKKLVFYFLIFFLFSWAPAFAEFEDVDEDFVIEEGDREDKDSDREKVSRERQKRTQMQKWLKQLEALKGSKKEASFLALTTKILNQEPDNIQALNTLGAFYLQRGNTQLAKIIFTRALKKHPKNSSLHNNLAVIALKEGKKEEAMKAFRKSLGYRYSNYASAANLGSLYMQAYEYDMALEYLNLGYSRAKQYLSLNHYEVLKTGNNYAVALAWSGNFRKSEDIFQELIEKNPGEVELLLNYAILLGKDLKEKEKSYQFLRKADLMDKSGRHARKIKALTRYLKTGKAAVKKKELLYLAQISRRKKQ